MSIPILSPKPNMIVVNARTPQPSKFSKYTHHIPNDTPFHNMDMVDGLINLRSFQSHQNHDFSTFNCAENNTFFLFWKGEVGGVFPKPTPSLSQWNSLWRSVTSWFTIRHPHRSFAMYLSSPRSHNTPTWSICLFHDIQLPVERLSAWASPFSSSWCIDNLT